MHKQHLKNALEEHYKLTCDWTGKPYIRITLDWDYNTCHVHLSMQNYMQKALKQFQHKAGKLQHAPYQSAPTQYGAKKQYPTQESKTPLLNDKAKWFIQQVCGKFLFISRAVDSTLLLLRRCQTICLMHDNVSSDNQLKVRELINLSCFYCLLLTCSVLLAVPALLGILATPSCLFVAGLGVLN
jgi:hypothetical protein